MNPQSKENIFEQLKIDEGIKHECYLCSEDVPTFGVGHKILETDPEYGMPMGTPVDDERIWEVFQEDLEIAIQGLEAIINESNDAIAVKIAEDTLEIIN